MFPKTLEVSSIVKLQPTQLFSYKKIYIYDLSPYPLLLAFYKFYEIK
jgi:hypothetical protein